MNINVGIVGFGWMGQVHAKALSRVLQHYRDLGVTPRLVGVADTADDGRLDYARNVFGAAFTTADWRELVEPGGHRPGLRRRARTSPIVT